MDLWRIGVRALFAYVVALALIRTAGRRSVKQGDAASFVVAVVIGDLFDDLLWAEVPASQFVVAIGTLVFAHLAVTLQTFKGGTREWRRRMSGVRS